MAAASVGVVAPIEGAAHGAQVFTETRDEIEKLLAEDASLYERGGTAGCRTDRRGIPADLAQGARGGSRAYRQAAVESRLGDGEGRASGRVLLRGRRSGE